MKILGAPFHTRYRPRQSSTPVVARRPILARAVRADVITPDLGPVLVWGEPLIGKSTLMRQVFWSLEPGRFLIARLPLGATATPVNDYSRAVRMLADQISVQLEGRGEGAGSHESIRAARALPEALDHSLAAAEQTKRTLIVCVEGVDRYVGGVWPAGVEESLRAVLARSPLLGVVLTSRLPLARLSEVAIPEHLRVSFVPRLEVHDAKRLLTEAVASWLTFEDEPLQWLLAAAGGRPFLLQILGRNAVRVARDADVGTIGPGLAQEVLTSCWLAAENLFRPLLGNLPLSSQRALAAVALATRPEQPTTRFENAYQVLRRLEDDGGEGDEASLTSFSNELSLLRLWRLVESDEQDAFWLGCGWLADYLRAGSG